ncbi:hypothetical protein F4561_005233 [Lipingzhangella halophila]|uniref:Uncharacterized protein n=1 Tax=Lipingzhangella halophila TaxID=1783352 RepID=A0A7W7RLX9_9ACTN|nr:hypothetical protein [Lipingzhangella halophila]MBB4934413.1 hypothetical protein [Lipingzhangella halophila]
MGDGIGDQFCGHRHDVVVIEALGRVAADPPARSAGIDAIATGEPRNDALGGCWVCLHERLLGV